MNSLLDGRDIVMTAIGGMTCRLRRRKAALTTYKPQHLSSDSYTLRDVGVIDKGCAQGLSSINVDDTPQSTSNGVKQQPSNHSAKPSNTGGRADDLPAKSVSDSLRTKRYQRRSSVNTSTHNPSPTNGRSKSEGEASEAEKKGRRQRGRLLDTKRAEGMSETSQSCDSTVNIHLACTAIAPLQNQIHAVKPKGWTKVHKTRLVGDAKRYWKKPNIERSLCVCTQPVPGSLERGCDERCLNRAMDYECDSNNCRIGDLCTNREFAGIEQPTGDPSSIGVEIIETLDRGFGVRARRPYRPHQVIIEHIDEVITPNEADRRMKEDYKDKNNYYQMGFDQGMILDATKGSVSRFVNHYCEPNCKMLRRFVEGQPRIALFAGDNGISTGEELTYDYNFK